MRNDINSEYLDKEFNEILRKMLKRDSVSIPILYDGDILKLEKTIEALKYLFDKCYEANMEEETTTRLSQMGGIYLSSIIYDLQDYKNKLYRYTKETKILEIKKNKKSNNCDWYTEFKGE